MSFQYISDKKGKKKAVIISVRDFKKIQEDLDDFAAIKVYDRAKAGKLTFRPLHAALKDIESKRAIKRK